MKNCFRVVLTDNAAIVDFQDPDNLLGYGEDKAELFTKSWFDVLIPDFCFEDVREIFMSLFEPDAASNGYARHQNAIIKKGGSLGNFEFHSRTVLMEGIPRLETYGCPEGSEALKRFRFPEKALS